MVEMAALVDLAAMVAPVDLVAHLAAMEATALVLLKPVAASRPSPASAAHPSHLLQVFRP
jgi:hypothetical protein